MTTHNPTEFSELILRLKDYLPFELNQPFYLNIQTHYHTKILI